MKKQFFLLSIFLMFSVLAKAQQDPQFTQIMFNKLLTNPGYAGSEDKICAYAMQRLQWVGFDGAPSTTLFNVDGAIKRFGLGLSVENSEVGFENNLRANISIAYRFPVGNGNLGLGIKWGIANAALDATWDTPEIDYGQDPAIPPESGNELSFMDFGFGLYYKTPDLYLGISSTQLYKTEFEFQKEDPTTGQSTTVSTVLKRHFYVTAGYNLPFSNPLWAFKPNVFVMSDIGNTQLAVNGIIEYNKKIWGGVSLRTDNAISGIFGMELFNWVKISYSYDFLVSDMIGYNSGTHEIMMGFSVDVKKDKTPEKYKSIRFL